jgi:proline dehydrogenase
MSLAKQGGFKLGIKLVRGAYLSSDPRELIWDTQKDTDACYNGIIESLLTNQWTADILPKIIDPPKNIPTVDLVIASHNKASVWKARSLLAQTSPPGRVVFAQLMGMADDLSCELIKPMNSNEIQTPKVYKNVVWGTTGECMQFLLRRAKENKDAVGRTLDTKHEVGQELRRRFMSLFGV